MPTNEQPLKQTVTSDDGTTIAFEQSGRGPAIILVAAALSDRSDTKRLARRLADRFTVIYYDRRGRGLSGDTMPYSVEREVDDITALIAYVGGQVSVFGSSSGAVLALTAANRFSEQVERLVMFEPPFIIDNGRPPLGQPFADRIASLLTQGGRAAVVKHFMTDGLGMPRLVVSMMRLFPGWKKMTTMALTLPYDLEVMADTQSGSALPIGRWPNVTMPTLVITGAKSETFFHDAADQLVERLPNALHLRLAKANHAAVVAAPKRLAQTIVGFADQTEDIVPVPVPFTHVAGF